jgi:hypothetical protein
VLVHGCAYRRWDARLLVEILRVAPEARLGLSKALRDAAVGLEELGAGGWGHDALLDALLDALEEPPSWEVVRA